VPPQEEELVPPPQEEQLVPPPPQEEQLVPPPPQEEEVVPEAHGSRGSTRPGTDQPIKRTGEDKSDSSPVLPGLTWPGSGEGEVEASRSDRLSSDL